MLNLITKPTVVYFHGWKSSPNSDKVIKLREQFNVIAPPLPTEFDDVLPIVNSYIKHLDPADVILVGTSLGGYWANYFAEKLNLPALLINPSCRPNETIGLEYPPITKDSVSKYNVPRVVLLAKDDSVLNPNIAYEIFNQYSQVIWFEEGGHRFNRIDEISKQIMNLYNQTAHLPC